MKIGILLPNIYASKKYRKMIFAPLPLAVSLADKLVEFGHQVFLYTAAGVKTKAKLITGDESLIPFKLSTKQIKKIGTAREKWRNFYLAKRFFELDLVQKAYLDAQSGKLDIIHSYQDYFVHFFDDLTSIPTVYTLHDPLPAKGTYEHWLLSKFRNHLFIAISNAFKKNPLKLNFIKTIYHGLNLDDFPLNLKPKNYFLFMGRLVPEKGLHTAIKTTLETKTPLKIGADFNFAVKKSNYFKKHINPYLKNRLIHEPGFVGKEKMVSLYQKAKALLFPIEWEEPFGMVLIEAMTAGTPVIAYNRGSVPEIIKDGKTGFLVDPKKGIEGFIKAAKNLLSLKDSQYQKMRANCRAHVEKHFTAQIMARNYEKVYRKVIAKSKK